MKLSDVALSLVLEFAFAFAVALALALALALTNACFGIDTAKNSPLALFVTERLLPCASIPVVRRN